MRKSTIIVTFIIGLVMYGCGQTGESEILGNENENKQMDVRKEAISEMESSGISQEDTSGAGTSGSQTGNSPDDKTSIHQTQNPTSVEVEQGGPYGKISLSIPEGWRYETCPCDSDDLLYGMYGIHFYPDGVKDGYVALVYVESFGVCGVGLAEEPSTIAGNPVSIGTYDENEYWDFIAFDGEYKGIVAFTYFVDDWWGEYGSQVLDIMDTLSYDSGIREGGAYLYHEESSIDKIGLSFSLKKISSTGATLVFNQFDEDAPTGELQYGDDFVLEQKKDGAWEEVPIVVEGNYAFHAIAYRIAAGDIVEMEVNWEWLYGELAPGEYRLSKSVNDFRGSGDYDKYTVYAYFIMN